jgi:hypothetical protein
LSPGLPLCARLTLSARLSLGALLALSARHTLHALRALRTGRTLSPGFTLGARRSRIPAATGKHHRRANNEDRHDFFHLTFPQRYFSAIRGKKSPDRNKNPRTLVRFKVANARKVALQRAGPLRDADAGRD